MCRSGVRRSRRISTNCPQHIRNISTGPPGRKPIFHPTLAAHISTVPAKCSGLARMAVPLRSIRAIVRRNIAAGANELGQLTCPNTHACQSPVLVRYRKPEGLSMHCSMPNHSLIRPTCPKCGMNMIATSKTNAKQAFECLRCGHLEQKAPGGYASDGCVRGQPRHSPSHDP